MNRTTDRKLKVLVAEDEEMILQIVEFALRRHGFDVVVARNGSEAMTSASTEMPDLVVMDMMMPVVSGYEATRTLKQSPETKMIPILGFTARAMQSERTLAFEAGCDDVLIKPFQIDDLFDRIASLIGEGGEKSGT
ncbi:MAG: PleD family two-component system response regulator [bacterium]